MENLLFSRLQGTAPLKALVNVWPGLRIDTIAKDLFRYTFSDGSSLLATNGQILDAETFAENHAKEFVWAAVWSWLYTTPVEKWPVSFRDALRDGETADPAGALILGQFLSGTMPK